MPLRRQIQHGNEESNPWEAVKGALFGVGCHSIQLDGLRLHVPASLRAKLGGLLNEPWIISIWIEGQLRVIPKELWEEYFRCVERELAQSSAAKSICPLIAQLAAEIKFDRANRWLIPTVLAKEAGLCGNYNQVNLLACEAWIEIWEAKRWDQHAKMALQPATSGLPSIPISSQAVPSVPNASQTSRP